MESIFFEITVVISLAAVLSIIFRLLRQPAVLAYILTGILLGPLGLFKLGNGDALHTLGQLGITLLLFMLGLELKLNDLRSLGKAVLLAGTLQMWFTFFAGFFLSLALGLPRMSALYVALAIAFSSTIIIVKLLSDKKDLTSLHGKLAIGILLVQDLVAILVIVFLPSVQYLSGASFFSHLAILIVKVVFLFAVITYLSHKVFPRIVHLLARSPESLFLFSLAWVFILTAIVTSPIIGFSIEIGGFLAGLALANAHENFQIMAKMKALRDFFITIFFVMLGLQMSFHNLGAVILPALVLSIFVLVIKPLIVMFLVSFMGYQKRTSFLVGLSMGQISEFSLIILFLGQSLGLLPGNVVTLTVSIGIISFTISTYVMQNNSVLYRDLHKYLGFLEGRGVKSPEAESLDQTLKNLKNHVVIIGGHQMGQSILEALNGDEQVLVVDFDPDQVTKLHEKGILSFFGDIADAEIQERAGIERAKLVISTVPDIEDNILLIEGVSHMNKRAKIVVMALDPEDAKLLYKAGADYVVMPHLAGGRHLAKILRDEDHSAAFAAFKKKDLSALG